MDATTLLKKDHDTVRELFKKYEKLGDRATASKQRLFEEIQQELEIHAKIEEEIFYPAVREARSKEAQEIVLEAIEEHNVVKTLLGEISDLTPEAEEYDAKVTVLQENVEHHADEEEKDMFPEAKKHLSKKELEQLGTEMEERKETLKEEMTGARSAR